MTNSRISCKLEHDHECNLRKCMYCTVCTVKLFALGGCYGIGHASVAAGAQYETGQVHTHSSNLWCPRMPSPQNPYANTTFSGSGQCKLIPPFMKACVEATTIFCNFPSAKKRSGHARRWRNGGGWLQSSFSTGSNSDPAGPQHSSPATCSLHQNVGLFCTPI